MKSKELAKAIQEYNLAALSVGAKDADILNEINGLIKCFKIDNGSITSANITEAFKIIFEGGGINMSHINIAGCKLTLSELLSGAKIGASAYGRITEIISHKPRLAFLCLVAQEMGLTADTSKWLANPTWLSMTGTSPALPAAAALKPKSMAEHALDSISATKAASDRTSEIAADAYGQVVATNTVAAARNDAEALVAMKAADERRRILEEMNKAAEIAGRRALVLGKIGLHDHVLSTQLQEIHGGTMRTLGAEFGATSSASAEASKRFAAASAASASAFSAGMASATDGHSSLPFAAAMSPGALAGAGYAHSSGSAAMPSAPSYGMPGAGAGLPDFASRYTPGGT